MSGIKGMKAYSFETKVKAVEMFFYERRTKKVILQTLDIKNDSQLEDWFRLYRKNGIDGLKAKPKGRPKIKIDENSSAESLNERIKQLEMENELFRAFLFDLGRR